MTIPSKPIAGTLSRAPEAPPAVPPDTATPKRRLTAIDGLRGFACLMVMMGHSWSHFGEHAMTLLRWRGFDFGVGSLLTYCYGGVEIFFALSGFCLAYPIVSRPDRAPDWRQYAVNRARRILPPYWVALAIFGVAAWVIQHRHIEPLLSAGVDKWDGVRQLLYSIPLLSVDYNVSFWTLGVEMRWYFVLPLLMLLLPRVRGGLNLALLTVPLCIASAAWLMPSHLERLKFLITNLFTFLPIFALGIWAAQLATKRRLAAWEAFLVRNAGWGLLAGIAAVGVFAPHWSVAFHQNEGLRRVAPWSLLCFFAVLAASQECRVQRLLDWRPLVAVGIFSYSLYLIHEPLIAAAAAVLKARQASPGVVMAFEFVIMPAVALTLAYGFFLAFEKPFLRRQRSASPLLNGGGDPPSGPSGVAPPPVAILSEPGQRPGSAPVSMEDVLTPAKPKPRLDSIDGLRGVACLMVVLYHSWGELGEPRWPLARVGGVTASLSHFLALGYGGVDIFFVLSGFCLAYPVVSRPDRPPDWLLYAKNRARRILPPYWAALAIFGVAAYLIARHHVEPFYSARVIPWSGWRQVIYSVPLIAFCFNPAFWTLAVEWRWYFLFPGFVAVWRKLGGAALVLLAVVIGVSSDFLFLPRMGGRIGFLVSPIPSFFPLFALGIWAADLAAKARPKPWERRLAELSWVGVAVAAIIVAALAPQKTLDYSAYSNLRRLVTWGPLCFFAVLAATQEGRVRAALSWKPLVGVGLFSYSLYLTHTPILAALAARLLPLHPRPPLLLALQALLLPAVCVGAAYLFYLAAERPFLRHKPGAGRQRRSVHAGSTLMLPAAWAADGEERPLWRPRRQE